MTQSNASLLMIVSAVMWGTNPALIKLVDWSPLGSAWMRGVFCAALLAAYLLVNRRLALKLTRLSILSALFLAVNSLLFVCASLYTSPANAVLLMFSFPWITLLLDFLVLNKRPLTGDLLRLILGLAGMTIIVSGGLNSPGRLGDVFALFAGLAIALHIFFAQQMARKEGANNDVANAVLLAWLMTAIVLAPFAFNGQRFNFENTHYMLAFGVLSALPWLLWSKAIAHISGHIVAALLGVEVFVAAMLGWIVLSDVPTLVTWIGGGMVLLAAMWQISSKAE